MLTQEQQEVADAAALRVLTVPADERESMLKVILDCYVDSFMKAFPDLPEEAVRKNSINYCRAVMRRIGEIEASGRTVGTA